MRILVEHSWWLVWVGIALGCVLARTVAGPSRRSQRDAARQRH